MSEGNIVIRKRASRFKRFPKKALLPFLACASAACALLLAVLEIAVRAPLREAAYETARDEAARAMTRAVSEALADGEEGFLSVESAGEESFVINADTVRLNRLIGAVTEGARELLKSSGSLGVSVGLGEASGLAALSGMGPRFNASFTPIGSVTAEPFSRLCSAGVNQSLFILELRLTARVLVRLAGRNEELEIKTTVPIAETVVVGRVPQVYTNVANEEDMLNLIPNEAP